MSLKVVNIVGKKLKKLKKSEQFMIINVDDDYKTLLVKLTPIAGLYRNQVYFLHLHISDKFPFVPPDVKFLSKVHHSNIYLNGKICLDILKDKWTPIYNFDVILYSIILLLNNSNPKSAANCTAAKQEIKLDKIFKSVNITNLNCDEVEIIKNKIYSSYIEEINKNNEYNMEIYKKYNKYFE